MTVEELKNEIYSTIKPQQWREGQFVFNYIDQQYGVARQVQFEDGIDCFYNDNMIDAFLKCSVERINKK